MKNPRNHRALSSHRKSAGSRPAIEPLEQRQLLTSVVVNTIADSTDAKGSSTVSLRDAIAIANAATSATAITFSTTVFSTAKTITLGGTQLELSNTAQAVTITGPAVGLTISGNSKSRIFLVDPSVTASVSGLTLTGGAATESDGSFFIGGGGAIENAGTLTVKNSTLVGNVVTNGYGGAINQEGGARLTLVNDTFANNTINGTGAGGGVSGAGVISMANVTISGNKAPDGGGFNGNPNFGPYNISNSIIAGNTSTNSGGVDVLSAFTSLGHNLIGKSTATWLSSDQVGTVAKPLNPLLGSLANNGGPTQTLLPLTGSPAIDKGSNSLIPSGTSTDQRGLPRTYNGTVDIGAVEVQPLIQISAPGSQTAIEGVSKSITLGSFTQYTNDAPYKDLITWGDGSASTTLSLTAAGTIPATAHAFTKAGTITVTEVITDAKGVVSNVASFTDTVTAPLGSISGQVFNDGNGDGKIDGNDLGLGLWTVYIDLKDTGSFVTGDPTSTTNIDGDFSFTGLSAGTYYIRVEPVTGTAATTPTVLTIKLTAGENSVGNLFGEKAIA